ncbi:porin family protein [Hymenobacter aerilatus]|uniref:Porin family protein n=1 Tax=Hymenobacter aerilatus TaxID=2932251 RepID=A0A8T9T2H7_9BACT|nr:outer membrane beta-barrel protein [Hymenobacter aerilatus]UOR06316.1 porin family protein [Hymenobacter aerilatus]
MKVQFVVRHRHGMALLSALLLSGAGASAQQAAPTLASAHSWYVGAQAGPSLQVYNTDKFNGTGMATAAIGVHGGYELQPRLMLQVGLAYGRGATPVEQLSGSGPFSNYPATNYIRSAWTVPAQLRWSFAKTPHRFQVQGLVGFSLCFFSQRYTAFRYEAGPKQTEDARDTNGYLNFGLGSNFRLTSRLHLATDLLTSANLQRPINSLYPIAPGVSAALGLNYRL